MEGVGGCRQCHECNRPYDWTPRVCAEPRHIKEGATSHVTVSFQVCSAACKLQYFRRRIMSEFNRIEKHRQMILVDGQPVIVARK